VGVMSGGSSVKGAPADSGGDGIKSPSVRGGSPVKLVSRPSDAGSDG